MPTQIPLHIPKFEGNHPEDLTNHVHSFHMWCSSNSIIEDSIHVLLFQHTLTGVISKWYVNQPHASYSTFLTLYNSFLSYFQLPLQYETRMDY